MNTVSFASPTSCTLQTERPAAEIPYLGLNLEVFVDRTQAEPLFGFVWRSLIGLVVKQYFPEIFQALFDESSSQSRLWSFAAVETEPGRLVQLRINLFG